MSIASATRQHPWLQFLQEAIYGDDVDAGALGARLVVFGELGLAGEIRPVQGGPERLREAAKHGFKRAIVPRANAPKIMTEEIEVIGVSRLADALAAME